MKPENDTKYWLHVSNLVDFITGSAVRLTAVITRLLLHKNIEDTSLYVQSILFDWKSGASADEAAVIPDDADRLLAPGDQVSAGLKNDPESLAKADRDGLLRFLPEDWALNLRAILDNNGASGEPLVGRTLALANEKTLNTKLDRVIQNANAHQRKGKLAKRGSSIDSTYTRVVVRCLFTTVGGMGNGSVYWFFRGSH